MKNNIIEYGVENNMEKYIHVNENICIQNFKAAADKNT